MTITEMFNFVYLGLDILLIAFNVMLLRRMHFENIAWPIIAMAIPASIYLAAIDFTVFFHWFNWNTMFLFSERVLIYKCMIVLGLTLSLIRVPVVYLRSRAKLTEEERLGGRDK